MDNKPEPKISTPEAILITAILFIAEIISAFLPIFGPWIVDLFSITLDFYLYQKKLPILRFILAQLAELIPIVSELPLLTAGFLVVVYMDRHPKAAKVITITAAVGAAAFTGGTSLAAAGGTAATEAGTAVAATATEAAAGAAGGATTAASGATLAGAEAAVGTEATMAAEAGTAASGAAGEAKLAQEALGEQKEPWEKVRDIMKELPEPETREKDEDDKREEYRQAA